MAEENRLPNELEEGTWTEGFYRGHVTYVGPCDCGNPGCELPAVYFKTAKSPSPDDRPCPPQTYAILAIMREREFGVRRSPRHENPDWGDLPTE